MKFIWLIIVVCLVNLASAVLYTTQDIANGTIISGNWDLGDPSELNDTIWVGTDNWAFTTTTAELYENYSKPANITNATYKVRYSFGVVNYVPNYAYLPTTCLN
jgi:hypothetical protein